MLWEEGDAGKGFAEARTVECGRGRDWSRPSELFWRSFPPCAQTLKRSCGFWNSGGRIPSQQCLDLPTYPSQCARKELFQGGRKQVPSPLLGLLDSTRHRTQSGKSKLHPWGRENLFFDSVSPPTLALVPLASAQLGSRIWGPDSPRAGPGVVS